MYAPVDQNGNKHIVDRLPKVFHRGRACNCTNKVGGAISNCCTPPCAAAAALQAFINRFLPSLVVQSGEMRQFVAMTAVKLKSDLANTEYKATG